MSPEVLEAKLGGTPPTLTKRSLRADAAPRGLTPIRARHTSLTRAITRTASRGLTQSQAGRSLPRETWHLATSEETESCSH